MPASKDVKNPKGEVTKFSQLLYANAKSDTTVKNAALYKEVYSSLRKTVIPECMCATQMIHIIKTSRGNAMKKLGTSKLTLKEKAFWDQIFITLQNLFW